MIRAHIQLITSNDVHNFVNELNSYKIWEDEFVLQDSTGRYCVNARSILGVLYFSLEHNDVTYLVNRTRDGCFPGFIDKYRVLDSTN